VITVTLASLVLAAVTLQRLSEVVVAHRNTRALLARGGVEHGAGHYPVMVALHASWLAALWIFGWDATVVVPLIVLYAALQFVRAWILKTLGARWTTRIITVPGESPVTDGPYKYVRHPNYLLVLLEVPLLPLALGLPWLATLFGVLNILMLWWRIKAEAKAWKEDGRPKPV
jgi:methyltransferase